MNYVQSWNKGNKFLLVNIYMCNIIGDNDMIFSIIWLKWTGKNFKYKQKWVFVKFDFC